MSVRTQGIVGYPKTIEKKQSTFMRGFNADKNIKNPYPRESQKWNWYRHGKIARAKYDKLKNKEGESHEL